MKIVDIKTHLLTYRLTDPIGSSLGTYHTRQALLVEIVTDEGIVGWGEAAAGPAAAQRVIEHSFRPILVGREATDIAVMWHEMYVSSRHFGQKGVAIGAISGVDIALWDILGKSLGVPIYKLMGGLFREEAQAYAMGLFYRQDETLADLQRRAAALIEAGFQGVKMKVGGAPWQEDVERVAAVREAIGPVAYLMVDANRAFNAAAATALGRQIAAYDIFWFEEPVPPEDIEGYCTVRGALPMFIAGGEAEYTRYGFRRLFQAQAVDVVQPEICATGGLSECRKIADMAHTAGVFYVPHMHGSALALAANLQLIASMAPVSSTFGPTPPTVELDTMANPLREELLVEPLAPVNGRLTVPSKPGLGVEVNREVVAQFSRDGA